MNVFEFLVEDHEQIKALLVRIQNTPTKPSELKRIAFKRLRHALDMHLYLEEVVFYPAVSVYDESRLKTIATEENNGIKILLEQLGERFKTHKNYKSDLELLAQKVINHIEEQEGPIFEKAQKLFDPQEAEKLGSEIEEERKLVRSDRKYEIEVY